MLKQFKLLTLTMFLLLPVAEAQQVAASELHFLTISGIARGLDGEPQPLTPGTQTRFWSDVGLGSIVSTIIAEPGSQPKMGIELKDFFVGALVTGSRRSFNVVLTGTEDRTQYAVAEIDFLYTGQTSDGEHFYGLRIKLGTPKFTGTPRNFFAVNPEVFSLKMVVGEAVVLPTLVKLDDSPTIVNLQLSIEER